MVRYSVILLVFVVVEGLWGVLVVEGYYWSDISFQKSID